MYQNIKQEFGLKMDSFSSIDHHKMHCIPLPQYVFSLPTIFNPTLALNN